MEIIYVSMTVLPENSERFKNSLQTIVGEARALTGTMKYDWYNKPAESNIFILYAEFETEDHYHMVYKKSSVLKLINHQLFPLLVGEPTFKHFRASLIESHNV